MGSDQTSPGTEHTHIHTHTHTHTHTHAHQPGSATEQGVRLECQAEEERCQAVLHLLQPLWSVQSTGLVCTMNLFGQYN